MSGGPFKFTARRRGDAAPAVSALAHPTRGHHERRGILDVGPLPLRTPSRVLSYKDIREAHHILEAAEAGKEW
jgi:hypothetical protein